MYDLIKDRKEDKQLKDYLGMAPALGLVMEFGVSSGSSLKEISSSTTKHVFGFDCWEGLPENWLDSKGNPRHSKGDFKSDRPKNLPSNCILVNGLFEDSLPKFVDIISDPISFIHIDCDLYSSTKKIFHHLKSFFQEGTIIAFDELLGYDGWENHEYKAFNEFLEETGFKWECVGRHGPFQYGMKLNK